MSSEDLSSSSSIITPTAMQQRSHRLSRQSHVHHQGLFTFFSYLFTLIVYFCFILSRHVSFSPIFHSANTFDYWHGNFIVIWFCFFVTELIFGIFLTGIKKLSPIFPYQETKPFFWIENRKSWNVWS